MPGQLTIAQKGEVIWTLLGSCVSVILYSKRKKVSAVCHAQLPKEGLNSTCKSSCPNPCGKEEGIQFKYVTCSLKYMFNEFKKLGIQKDELEVKLYGGSSILDMDVEHKPRIGQLNILAAKVILEQNNLKINVEDVGGKYPRILTHYSDTGITELKTDNTRQ